MTTTSSIESLFDRINKLRKKQLSYLTAEQATEYGFDLDPDWAVKVDWDGDIPRYTYVSPEKWEFSDLLYGEEGELTEYRALSPQGKLYTKAELDKLTAEPKEPEVPSNLI